MIGAAADTGIEATRPRLVISTLEHSSVAEAAAALERSGTELHHLPIRPDGSVDGEVLESLLATRPRLLSVQAVNSVTGLRLPTEALCEVAARHRVPVHVDAVQAIGRVTLPPTGEPGVILTLSAHKLGGPKGAAVLVIPPSLELRPRLFGGGQEGGMRPGTEDVEGAVGMATALELACRGMESEVERLSGLRERLERGIGPVLPGTRVHGAEGPRAPHILHLGVPGVDAELLLAALDLEGVAASAGSACRSGTAEPGPALEALYGAEVRRRAPLRLSLGWNTTAAQVEEAVERITSVLQRLGDRSTPTRDERTP